MWIKSVTLYTGYNVEQGVSPELLSNERGAMDPSLHAASGERAAGDQLPAFGTVTGHRPPDGSRSMRQASPGVMEMSIWRTIASTIALVIVTGARWSARWIKALASGDRIFSSLHLASTTFPSVTRSSGPRVSVPAQASPDVVTLPHALPLHSSRRLHRDIGATPV